MPDMQSTELTSHLPPLTSEADKELLDKYGVSSDRLQEAEDDLIKATTAEEIAAAQQEITIAKAQIAEAAPPAAEALSSSSSSLAFRNDSHQVISQEICDTYIRITRDTTESAMELDAADLTVTDAQEQLTATAAALVILETALPTLPELQNNVNTARSRVISTSNKLAAAETDLDKALATYRNNVDQMHIFLTKNDLSSHIDRFPEMIQGAVFILRHHIDSSPTLQEGATRAMHKEQLEALLQQFWG
jgi:predicted  nucleic acid-binding Zn-ribbon protein